MHQDDNGNMYAREPRPAAPGISVFFGAGVAGAFISCRMGYSRPECQGCVEPDGEEANSTSQGLPSTCF